MEQERKRSNSRKSEWGVGWERRRGRQERGRGQERGGRGGEQKRERSESRKRKSGAGNSEGKAVKSRIDDLGGCTT